MGKKKTIPRSSSLVFNNFDFLKLTLNITEYVGEKQL